MWFQDKDFCQKLIRVLTLDEESITPDPDSIHALLACHAQVHHTGIPTQVQSLNIFVPLSGKPQQNTSAFGGNGKSGWNEQECIEWIPAVTPLQRGVPSAKRANSYSVAVVMTCKTGESPSNGAPPKVDTHFRRH